MALSLPVSSFEAPPFVLNRIPFRSLSSSRPSILTFSLPQRIRRRKPSFILAAIGKEDVDLDVEIKNEKMDLNASGELEDASPEDLEYIGKIKRVLELLKKNRDMLFGEIKLTIIIEDPRDIERKRLLGIEDPDDVTRDDLASALEDVEAPKTKRNKSLYARATDTGVDPRQAAKRLNIDWDSAADIEAGDEDEDIQVPPAMGYGALYLVTALPLIIGVSVVLILFYNSLQ